MNVELRSSPATNTAAASRIAIADCDIHPTTRSSHDLDEWLPQRWLEHRRMFGTMRRQGSEAGPAYPKSQPHASRRDAYPPEGGRQGSSLSFMQAQHLDANNVVLGVLNPLNSAQSGQGVSNPDYAAVLCRAVNHWQIEKWTNRDSRLKASIVVPYEDPQSSVAEIRHWIGNPATKPHFVQVLLLSRTADPLGNRRYWPLYEAAEEAGLPVAIHAFGFGGPPVTSTGWPSFYIEDMVGHAQSCQAGLTSLIIEGVFERFPKLKVVLVEAGFAWAPALIWRLDKVWKTLRAETPHISRLPSEIIREHVWWTTQPMEEPEPRTHLLDAIGWIGWDQLLFATDYPHWDFDDPAYALPLSLTKQQRQSVFLDNARTMYGLR